MKRTFHSLVVDFAVLVCLLWAGAAVLGWIFYFSTIHELEGRRAEVITLRKVNADLIAERDHWRGRALKAEKTVKWMTKFGVRQVTATAYTPTTEECDEDPHVAASMRKVKPGTIAVSRDLFDEGWVFGRKVRIEGLGIYEINDLMNAKYEERIDVFMWSRANARRFGKRQVKASLLDM
jgi:3D (Asp-Asp-Asp) domain-containing protein